MSVLNIHLDACDEYARAIVQLYSRMPRQQLVEYLGKLELLAEDRMCTFLKIDLDVEVPPPKVNATGWLITTVTLKSRERQPMELFVNLFYEGFPHPISVDHEDERVFSCSGPLDGGTEGLSESDLATFVRLTRYEADQQERVASVSQEFNAMADREKLNEHQLGSILVELAQRFELHSGRWIYFTKHVEAATREAFFDYLLQSFCDEAVVRTASRFNAKISPEFLVMSFSNFHTLASTSPSLLTGAGRSNKQVPRDDKGVGEILNALNGIYHPKLLGNLTIRYKPEIVSCCCIQHNSVSLRPTIYAKSYATNYYDWYAKEPASSASRR